MKENTLNVTKHCLKSNGNICNIEAFYTAEKSPKNIRIGCTIHSYYLPKSYTSVEDAIKAWEKENERN